MQGGNLSVGTFLLISMVKIVIALAILLFIVAYTVWLERKLVGRIQNRWGPSRVGPFGLLQPVADGIKLLLHRRHVLNRWLEEKLDQVKELHALLAQTGVPGPYILVGHSIAGYNMLLFTDQYPKEVVGLVCVWVVGCASEDQEARGAGLL